MNRGFTLVELIVVIAIIGLLATVGITSYNNTLEDSKKTKAMADIKELKEAIDTYYYRTGNWPCQDTSKCDDGSYNITKTTTWNSSTTGLVPTYLESVPNDPWGNAYFYDGAPNTECGPGLISICSPGRDKKFESQNNASQVVKGDDVCIYMPSDC